MIAHRGNSGEEPENTMAAFRSAIELGARMIELDVHLSRDGQAVVVHDDTVDRTTNGHGRVGVLTAAELSKLDAGRGERIPLLADVLDLNVSIDVEVKNREAAEEVLRTVRERGRTLISSFDHALLDQIAKQHPALPLAYLAERRRPRAALGRAVAAHAYALNLAATSTTRDLVEDAHEAGLRVYCYTVNDEREAERLFEWDVDGIFTDKLRAMLARFGP